MTLITRSSAALLCLVVLAAVATADTLTLRDGTRVQGKVIAFTADTLTFRGDDGFARNYHTDLVATLSFIPIDRPRGGGVRRPDGADGRGAGAQSGLVAPAGTELVVRTAELADSSTVVPGQTFTAVIEQRVSDAAGRVIVPVGASAQLVIRELTTVGATGSPDLAIDVQSITVAGRRYAASAADVKAENETGLGAVERTARSAGGGALLGTVIDAGVLVVTRGREVRVPADTVLRFRLDHATMLFADP